MKIDNFTLIFSLFFFLVFSCKNEKTIIVSELIKGDWLSENIIEKSSLTFEESICSYKNFGQKPAYQIKGDSLLIAKKLNIIDKWGHSYNFKIIFISKDSLVLNPLTKESGELFYNLDKKYIVFKKVKKKNNLNFKRIGLYSSLCFGSCPSMYLEIDSDGNILFEGLFNTKEIGYYYGTLSMKEQFILNQKINNINIENIKQIYEAEYTDAQTIQMAIQFNSDTLKTLVYGNSQEPLELRLLFQYIMELHNTVNLKKEPKDFYVLERVELKEFLLKRLPPLPPKPSLFN